jgi:hypothetical protein
LDSVRLFDATANRGTLVPEFGFPYGFVTIFGLTLRRDKPGVGMEQILGHVTAAGASQVTACLESGVASDGFGRIGDMVKVRCDEHDVVGTVSAARVEPGPPPRDVVVVELLGEIVSTYASGVQFSRGVSRYPVSGAAIIGATDDDLAAILPRPPARISALARFTTTRRVRHSC